jgi:AAA domain
VTDWKSPPGIEPRQDVVDQIHAEVFADRVTKRSQQPSKPASPSTASLSFSDAELLDRARKARDGAKFSKLYDAGDISDYRSGDNDGRSEADFALVAKLYFWCGPDAGRIERLWRASTLARAKLGRGDYVARTIDAVMAGGGPTYSGGKPYMGANGASAGAHNAGTNQQQHQNNNNVGVRRASIKLSSIAAKKIEWLWEHTIPLGKPTGIIADPGIGKSILIRDLAARVTVGRPFPDGSPCQPGTVVFIDDENGIADTIRPSIDAQGGHADKVVIFKLQNSAEAEVQFDIGAHINELREEIREHADTRMVVIDPPTSYLGDIDEVKNAQVRAVLTPLKPLAEETNIAIVLAMHFNKAATMDILYRITGSMAFVELPRITWALVMDPQDSNRRLMLLHKTNITRKDLPGFAFTVQENADGYPTLNWCDEPPTVDLRDVTAGFQNQKRWRGPSSGLADQVSAWLCGNVLADGQEHLERDIKQAAKLRGFTESTYLRARRQLRKQQLIRSRAEGFGSDRQWWVSLMRN